MKEVEIDVPSKCFNISSIAISSSHPGHYNYLLFFFFLPSKEVCVGGNEKKKCREYFFSIPFHMTDCIFIFTYCNPNTILALILMNNIRKDLVMIATHYGNQITTKQIRAQYQS